MAASYHHAVSSASRWGGKPEDYMHIHEWFDETKNHFGDFRHRAVRHHTEGIAECTSVFGAVLENSEGAKIPVRWIAEQHVTEDFGRLVTLHEWLQCIRPEPWMTRARKLSQEEEIRTWTK